MKSFTDAGRWEGVTAGRKAWLVVGLSASTQAVNQIDKAVLGLAAEPIMHELSLSPAQYGIVAGSLFAFFAVGGLFTAFFAAPRFTPRHILIILLLIWSLSQLPIVFAASLTVLVICRMILGAAEGGAPATCMNICHEWFPDDKREIPTASILVGGILGALISAPLLTYVITAYGWRSAFLICSAVGLLVLVAWLFFKADGPYGAPVGHQAKGAPGGLPLTYLLRDRTVFGNILVGFCAYWIVGFMLAWLAPYVRNQGGFSPMESGWVLSLIYFGQGVLLFAVAAFAQFLLGLKYSSRVARAYLMGGCLAGSALCFVALAFVSDPLHKVVLMALATGLPGCVFTLSSAMISEVAPASGRNRLMTIVMAIMTTSALVSPSIAGALIDLGSPHGWRPALLVMAGVAAVGALCGLFMLHPARTTRAFSAAAAAMHPDHSCGERHA